ncbi:MAG: PIN domain-containing protein [Thermoplasmata archaeon]
MRRVILDANALMMPFQFGINLDLELERLLGSFEVLVPTPVLIELNALASTNNLARRALRLAKKYEKIESKGNADDVLLDLARNKKAIVVSNDKKVISSLRKEGLPYVRLRSHSHLVLEGTL